ncbi:MAG: putative toxin-antitoxin system toxin component, PIN family [Salinivirgaceae bacterium]|jgi:putative toxin-antitoxin system toxin component, PIN family|nr:putative toxin-antitoxin system toxin component, PIN family [Salinivirgaceae bacterium]
MRRRTKIRVVVDNNCWISFLIGRRLSKLVDLLSNERVILVICSELLAELRDVTSRPKFAKYFNQSDVESLIDFMQIIGETIEPQQSVKICRDAADDYLLALAAEAKAEYLVTGDDDLLVIKEIGACQIVDVSTFEQIIS